ncbi:hypothetical protein MC885_002082, partial [Smutsia gigantea]
MPVGGLLPLFSSPAGGGLGGGLGGGGGGGGRKASGPAAFRLTEKFVLLLVFSAFITLCFGAIFFLPDSSKLLSGVLFHSSPALQSAADHKPGPGARAEDAAEGRARRGEEGAPGDPEAALEDNLARIRENHERALREAKETLQKLPEEIQRDILLEKEKVAQDQLRDKALFRRLPPVDFVPPVGAVGREPADAAIREKRAKIKEGQEEELGTELERDLKWGGRKFMKDAKQAPEALLLGSFPSSQAPFGMCRFGARSGSVSTDPTKDCPLCIGSRRAQRLQLTLLRLASSEKVKALFTLLRGLQARPKPILLRGCSPSLRQSRTRNAEVSVFEVNIRFVGGLLSAYYLSGEE